MKRTPLKRGTKSLKRSGFKRNGGNTLSRSKKLATGKISGKNRYSSLRRVGTIGEANLKANQLIREYLEMHPIHSCELMFEGCLGNMFLQVAHRHPRAWYKGDVAKLADPNQWLCACQVCHSILDARTAESKELTENVFKQLRP